MFFDDVMVNAVDGIVVAGFIGVVSDFLVVQILSWSLEQSKFVKDCSCKCQ